MAKQRMVYFDGQRMPRKKARHALRKAGCPPWAIRAYMATAAFDNPDQPRGQPNNPGQFAKSTDKSLRENKISTSKNLTGSANKVALHTLEDGTNGIFKPESGADKTLRKTIKENFSGREVAASDFADIVGMREMVPVTVHRTIDGEHGSFQHFVDNAKVASEGKYGDRHGNSLADHAMAAAFDYAIGQTDRHMGNWMVTKKKKLKLIDNGLSFPEGNELSVSRLITGMHGQPVPRAAKEWVNKWPEIKNSLEKNGLSKKAIDLTLSRLNELANMDKFGTGQRHLIKDDKIARRAKTMPASELEQHKSEEEPAKIPERPPSVARRLLKKFFGG